MIITTGRIWEAASKDESRPVLTHVYFDADAATLSATNSYIAARVPCEVEKGDESGLIPAEAVKLAFNGGNPRSLRVAKGKATLKLPDGERIWTLPPANTTFPDLDEIFSKAGEAAPFGVNHRLLQEVANALGVAKDHPVHLHPTHPLRPIRVATRDGEGIIMPVRLAGDAPVPYPDFGDDTAVIAGVHAAIALLDKRRGKKKAAEAFRAAVAEATQAAAGAAKKAAAA